jgi:hypothetical protein
MLAGLAALVLLIQAAPASAGVQWYFKHGAWVCATPEAYASALDSQRHLNGKPFDELRKELFEKGQCVYIEDEEIGDVMAPYITLLESREHMAHVSFVIRYEKRLAFLHRQLNWYKFTGWTEADNLKELW